MGVNRQVDLVIAGAGATGLGVARRAQEFGPSLICRETMDRIAGRARTDTTTFGFPWNRGCHWWHSGSVNVFAQLADRYGIGYETTSPHCRNHDGDRWLTDLQHSEAEHATSVEMRGAMFPLPRLWR